MVDRERVRFCPRFWPLTALAVLIAAAATAAVTGLRAEDGPGSPPPPPPLPPPGTQPVPVQVATQFFAVAPAPRRFQFTIPADAPVKDLLPAAPAAPRARGTPTTLAGVPEVDFQAALAKGIASDEAMKQTAHTIAKVNHMNAKKADGFMDALRGDRPDLVGLPFLMGDHCRIKGDRSRELTRAVGTVRSALRGQAGQRQAGTITLATGAMSAPAMPAPTQPPRIESAPPIVPQASPAPPIPAPPAPAQIAVADFAINVTATTERPSPATFWEQYTAACAQEDKQVPTVDRAQQETVLLARVAALMQVLAPEAPAFRLGLVKYLAAVSHVEATRALARLALFSDEDEVRLAAVNALKVRRERDYTDILVDGLRYPWPAVAQRAADAVARLERTDLLPRLVAVLDEPDPRAPIAKTVAGKQVHEARELVRVNHHRNCLLCHAPGNAPGVSAETLTAAVPVPTDPLPNPTEGYQITSPDVLVRIDVTYLRPDFSMMQAVADAHPWPEMQRFDFLVRTRTVTDDEASTLRAAVSEEPDRPSPYHRAALAALRDLTGRDAAPTAEAWRKVLSMPTVTH